MGSILASTILTEASSLLQDTARVHWTQAELLTYLNDGARSIARKAPGAYVVSTNKVLPAGSRQTAPADCVVILDIPDNVTGEIITRVDRTSLDSIDPTWRAATPAGVVQEYMYDTGTPQLFDVSPPSDGAADVNMVYAAVPADIAYGDPIAVSDQYSPALHDFVMFRALSKEATTKDEARAALYFDSFTSALP